MRSAFYLLDSTLGDVSEEAETKQRVPISRFLSTLDQLSLASHSHSGKFSASDFKGTVEDNRITVIPRGMDAAVVMCGHLRLSPGRAARKTTRLSTGR